MASFPFFPNQDSCFRSGTSFLPGSEHSLQNAFPPGPTKQGRRRDLRDINDPFPVFSQTIKDFGSSIDTFTTRFSFCAIPRNFFVCFDTVELSKSNTPRISSVLTTIFCPKCRYIYSSSSGRTRPASTWKRFPVSCKLTVSGLQQVRKTCLPCR